MRQTRLARGGRIIRRRGFTAVEIAMVATVIAILALLILPIFRERTEAARLASAHDEVASIAKAMLLVEADTGIQVRLSDLDNGLSQGTFDPNQVHTLPPIATWNSTLESLTQPKTRLTVETNWGGPYAAFKREMTFQDIFDTVPNFFVENGGPIYHVTAANAYTGGVTDSPDDRYPADPWGSPYIFYGIGRLDYGLDGAFAADESVFNSSIVYSLGPDGTAGSSGIPISTSTTPYERAQGILGTGDDVEFRF